MPCLSICPSVFPQGTSRLPLNEIFMKSDIWVLLKTMSRKFKFHGNRSRIRGYFTRRPVYIFKKYLAHFFLEWEMFHTKVAEKIKTHFVFGNFIFFKIVLFMRQRGKIFQTGACHRWKYCACALHAGYLKLRIQTPRLCNTHCSSTATMVARIRLSVALYLLCLSRFIINPLATELGIYSLAHHLYKWWIYYEPSRVTLGNTCYFVE